MLGVLKRMGFCYTWVGRNETCVSTVTYEVNVNGKRTRTIRQSRGLRHGDPLSPYLFILVANVLSRLLEEQVARGNMNGKRSKAGCPEIHHLFFVDDSHLFIREPVDLDIFAESSSSIIEHQNRWSTSQNPTYSSMRLRMTVSNEK